MANFAVPVLRGRRWRRGWRHGRLGRGRMNLSQWGGFWVGHFVLVVGRLEGPVWTFLVATVSQKEPAPSKHVSCRGEFTTLKRIMLPTEIGIVQESLWANQYNGMSQGFWMRVWGFEGEADPPEIPDELFLSLTCGVSELRAGELTCS